MQKEPPCILVVDDEPDICWTLENALRPEGYAVTTTTKGVEAAEWITQRRYVAAFVDAKLPDLDGLELASVIRQRSPHTVVILISAYFYPDNGAIVEGLRTGLFSGFLAKPFDLEDVRRMARQAVKQAEKED